MNHWIDTALTRSQSHRAWLAAAGLALATGAVTLGVSRVGAAHGDGGASTFERRCIGTYLVLEEGTQAQTLWTFHADRTLIASSSGEELFVFSGQQGSWRPEGETGAKAVELTFDWDDTGALEAIGRVDIDVRADDRRCDTIRGEFVGRLFFAGEDPLELGDSAPLYGDTIVGRRVSAP